MLGGAAARGDLTTGDDISTAYELAGLPSGRDIDDTDERAKRFDLFALRAQLSALDGDLDLDPAAKRIRAIASALADQKSIPAVAKEIDLIAAVADRDWWTDATVPMIEMVRKRLRGLVGLIDTAQRAIVYTDFNDTITEVSDVALTLVAHGVDRARFRDKAYAFLQSHEDDAVLFKLRHGKQLTPLDLEQLEKIMLASGDFTEPELRAAIDEAQGLGLFVRSIVGMDRAAAAEALSGFSNSLSGNQLAFITLVIEHLTRAGIVEPGLLYEPPFTGVAPTGPEAIFSDAQVTDLIGVLTRIRDSAQPTLAG